MLAAARRCQLQWCWAQATPDISALEITSSVPGGYLSDALLVYAEGHPYWDIRNPPGMVDRYSHVVNARMHAMRRNLDVWKREDFKIEKDKCDMTQFLINNELPTPPLIAVWRGDKPLPSQLTRCADAGDALCCTEAALPAFVKACHITQGFLSSVFHLTRSNPNPNSSPNLTPTLTPTLTLTLTPTLTPTLTLTLHQVFHLKSCAQLPELETWMERMLKVAIVSIARDRQADRQS